MCASSTNSKRPTNKQSTGTQPTGRPITDTSSRSEQFGTSPIGVPSVSKSLTQSLFGRLSAGMFLTRAASTNKHSTDIPPTGKQSQSATKLLSRDFLFILASNFLLFFAFYLVLPVFALFLMEEFHTDSSTAGLVLSCYTVASLVMRAFSGYLVDSFPRKPIYLTGFIGLTLIFLGYTVAGSLALIIGLRMLHGAFFGLVSVSGNTIVIDITPSARRGEAIGFYGLMNNLALCLGPMTSLFMHNSGMSYDSIFHCSFLAGALGIVMVSFVRTPYKPPLRREPLSFDRFILFKGLPASLSLLLIAIPYGMTSTYIALYARDIGIHHSTGLFFSCMAVGLGMSRFFSGREADRGRGPRIIQIGMTFSLIVFALMASLLVLKDLHSTLTEWIFFGAAFGMGVSYGSMFPAFTTLFVNLAPNTKRGTATSTYLTSWDIGISIGLLLGGWIMNHFSFDNAYLIALLLTASSFLFFHLYVVPHYHHHKLS